MGAPGWVVMGAAPAGPSPELLCEVTFDCGAEDGSGPTSAGLPKQWPREEQGSPCMVGDPGSDEQYQAEIQAQPGGDMSWVGFFFSR